MDKTSEQEYQHQYYLKNKERINANKKLRYSKNINGYRVFQIFTSNMILRAKQVNKHSVIHDGVREPLYSYAFIEHRRAYLTFYTWQKAGIIPKGYGKMFSLSQSKLIGTVLDLSAKYKYKLSEIKELFEGFWYKQYNEKEVLNYVKDKGLDKWDNDRKERKKISSDSKP